MINIAGINYLMLNYKREPIPFKVVHVPVTCDLSYGAIELAINLSKENDLGMPQCLLVAIESKFIARELLERAPKWLQGQIVYMFDNRSPGSWMFIFEFGIVIGESENSGLSRSNIR